MKLDEGQQYRDKTLQPVALVNRDEELSLSLCTPITSTITWRNALYVTVLRHIQTTSIPSIGLDHVYPHGSALQL
jgi:hypothetical protein